MGQWAVGGLERKSAQEGQGQWVCDSVDSPFQGPGPGTAGPLSFRGQRLSSPGFGGQGYLPVDVYMSFRTWN